MSGFSDLLSLLGVWLGGRKATAPVEPGCIEIDISAASIGLGVRAAGSIALSVRAAGSISISVEVCRS